MTFKLGQALYAPTKLGNVKTWCCNVNKLGEGETELCITTQTKIDGKPVVRYEMFTEGKNVGRSNETTPYQQAISEALSRYRKKLDQGYRTDIPSDTTQAGANSLDLPKPMLAHPIDKVKDVRFPAMVQPKLDGHRAIVTKQNGEMMMYSRQGKEIRTMDHILVHLDLVMNEGEFLDGELYLHGKALQNIGSFIKKEQLGSADVEFWVYDIMKDASYDKRYAMLQAKLANVNRIARIHLLQAYNVASMDEAMDMFDDFVAKGYEGAILRLLDAGYEAGFRSRNLLKIKPFDDNEFEIIGVKEGKDRIVNDVDLKVAIFECVTPDGKEFEVTAPGDMYAKDEAWKNRKSFIGKFVTVKHSGYTVDKKPWHPVAMRIREDI